MATSLRVQNMNNTNVRHYVISCENCSFRFSRIEFHNDRKGFDVCYNYNGRNKLTTIVVVDDEVDIAYCQLSDDKSKIYSGVNYVPSRTSQPDRINVNFEDLESSVKSSVKSSNHQPGREWCSDTY